MMSIYSAHTTKKVIDALHKQDESSGDYIMKLFADLVERKQTNYKKYDLRCDIINDLARRYCTNFNVMLNNFAANMKKVTRKIAKRLGELKVTYAEQGRQETRTVSCGYFATALANYAVNGTIVPEVLEALQGKRAAHLALDAFLANIALFRPL
jgi:hypothetical protein